MKETLTKCPLCQHEHFSIVQEVVDHAVSKESYQLTKCANCELIFTNPRPKEEHIAPYYDFPEYYSHNDEVSSITGFAYNLVRKRALASKVKLFKSLKPDFGNILDIGCGTGELLNKAKESGWGVEGVEPNEKARVQAKAKLGDNVYESIQNIQSKESYDIISLFHVLEHIHELNNSMNIITTSLKSNGYIIIAVPNPESYDAKKYGNNWAGWDIPRHLYHFSKKAMNSLAEIHQLELIKMIPMPFDSYYVSLLSEGYINPNQSAISKYSKAILNGRKSNSMAKANENNYSSILYIFKKK